MSTSRPVALVTGASRRRGIGAAIVTALAEGGWDVATTVWRPYDAEVHGEADSGEPEEVLAEARERGATCVAVECDLCADGAAAHVFDAVEGRLGHVTALVLSHCHSVDSGILDTTEQSWDRHFAVNARASWLLVRELARRFRGERGRGRIVALTSDHVAGNLPYGTSKGALDRLMIAAAHELGSLGITANAVDPGPTDTGWMSEAQRAEFARRTALGRLGQPRDCARLVAFLCSERGGWITGQLIRSDGGWS